MRRMAWGANCSRGCVKARRRRTRARRFSSRVATMVLRVAVLLFVCLAAQGGSAGDWCKRRLLSEDERASLATVVMRHTGIAPNLSTEFTCKDHFGTLLQTFRVAAGSGTQKWFDLSCSKVRMPWPEPWHCIEYPH